MYACTLYKIILEGSEAKAWLRRGLCAADGAGISRLFFFAHSTRVTGQTAAKHLHMINKYKPAYKKEEELGAAVAGGDDPLAAVAADGAAQ